MTHEAQLPPHRFAALVAPVIDRVFFGGIAAGRARGGAELSQRYGGPAATGFLLEFRTRLAAPRGVVSASGFAAVTRYRDPAECQRALDKQVAYGMIHRWGPTDPRTSPEPGPSGGDAGFRATERGRAFLAEIYALHATVTAELWADEHPARVGRLLDVLGRLLVAAEETGGEAYGAMAPPYEPDGTPPGVLLLNRLSTLRYHRADAHAAAWIAAGHTAQSIAALPPGPERTAIEQETDRRAAPPYAVLTAQERLVLLADLAALPG